MFWSMKYDYDILVLFMTIRSTKQTKNTKKEFVVFFTTMC